MDFSQFGIMFLAPFGPALVTTFLILWKMNRKLQKNSSYDHNENSDPGVHTLS
jgi:hypothetical protein